tara:strand:- start:299 stop:586 length:288 start_codon:yes stop_codon:yes gene_type:complete
MRNRAMTPGSKEHPTPEILKAAFIEVWAKTSTEPHEVETKTCDNGKVLEYRRHSFEWKGELMKDGNPFVMWFTEVALYVPDGDELEYKGAELRFD